MEFGTREILIIVGVVVIFGILLHGFRSVRHSRNGSIKVGRRRQGIFEDDGFDDLPGELLTGEVRVTKRDKTRIEEVSDSIKRSWESNAERKTSAFRERYERSGNVVPFQPGDSVRQPARPQSLPVEEPPVENESRVQHRRERSARRANRDEIPSVIREEVGEAPPAVEPDIQVSLDEFAVDDEPQAAPERAAPRHDDAPPRDDAPYGRDVVEDDQQLFDDNYGIDAVEEDSRSAVAAPRGRDYAEPQHQGGAEPRRWGQDNRPHAARDEPLVARRDEDLEPAPRRESTWRGEGADARRGQRRKPFWEESPPPAPAQAPEPEPDPAPSQSVAPTEVVVLHVMARKGATFPGKDLLDALLTNGMRYGSMQIFHRHLHPDGSGPVLFSLANSVKPGIFDLAAMDDFQTPGVSMFMALEGLDNPLEAYKELIKTAQNLAKTLNGSVLDETRSVLTKQTIEHYRQQIIEFTRRSFTLTH